MRLFFIFCLISLTPGLYLTVNDYIKSTQRPDKTFTFSTIADVWIEHDRGGFMAFRSNYMDKQKEWEEEVLPYLNMKAAPLATIPLLALMVLALCAWLLGIGPFGQWTPGGHHGVNRGGAGRARPSQQGHQVRYKRK